MTANLASFGRLTLVFSLFFISNIAVAQAEKLFTPLDDKVVLSSNAAKKVVDIKARNKSKAAGLFKFRFSVMEAKSFVLNLPDGRAVIMQRKFLNKTPTHMAYAASSDAEQVHMTLVTSGATVSGNIFTQTGVYGIDAVDEDGVYLISAIDKSTIPIDAPPPHGRAVAPPELDQREKEYQEEKKRNRSTGKEQSAFIDPQVATTAAASGAVVVDVMVQYTASARSYGGGSDASITSDIRNAAGQANLSLVNSGINVQLNIVDISYTNFSEAGKTTRQALEAWAPRPDVGLRRNQVAADAVVLVASTLGNYCGDTYPGPDVGRAYSAVNVACLKTGLILPHEIGHVFGADHNIGASDAPINSGGYAHGWPGTSDTKTKVYNGTTYWACVYTMMAYPTANPGCALSDMQRLLYWSGPATAVSLYYNGTNVQSNWTLGSSTANNVLQVNNTASLVSSFRGPSGGGSGNGGGNGSEGTNTQSIFTMISRLLGGW